MNPLEKAQVAPLQAQVVAQTTNKSKKATPTPPQAPQAPLAPQPSTPPQALVPQMPCLEFKCALLAHDLTLFHDKSAHVKIQNVQDDGEVFAFFPIENLNFKFDQRGFVHNKNELTITNTSDTCLEVPRGTCVGAYCHIKVNADVNFF